MQKLIVALAFAVSALALPLVAEAKDCLLCGAGSSNGCQQCDAGGTDSKARSACEKAGCKISGTGSCSTAANVKVCKANNVRSTIERENELSIPWCAAK